MFRTLAALLLLAAVVLTGVRLGIWQLDRAAQRIAIKEAIDRGRAAAPLELHPDTPSDDLTAWRSARAHGTWLHQYTVLLENRSYDGRPGYWVATPLQLEHTNPIASNGTPTAVLVLRGWLARPTQINQGLPAIPAPTGQHTVQGELLDRVPRLFELWSWSSTPQAQLPSTLPDPAQPLPVIQNLDVDALSKASGLALIPSVLAADPDTSSGLLQDWPEPSLDADKNHGYALQWFGFATIAGVAWLVVFWRALKRRRQRRS